MNRRELLAGVGSIGALATAGVVATRGLPERSDDTGSTEPVTIETVDATGSEAGTQTVPGEEPMVLDFFATTCETCKTQMPILNSLADATESTVLSITIEQDPEAIQAFWDEYNGNWPVGIDERIDLYPLYEVVQTPTTLVIDAAGRTHWRGEGEKDEAAILTALEEA